MKTRQRTSSTPSPQNSTPEAQGLVILGGGTGSTIAAGTFAGQGKRVAVIERKYSSCLERPLAADQLRCRTSRRDCRRNSRYALQCSNHR